LEGPDLHRHAPGANGDAIGFPTDFALDRSNGTLIENTDGEPATITFHRLSPRPRHRLQGGDHSAGSFSRRNATARAAIAA
jgi:hypothetical protein